MQSFLFLIDGRLHRGLRSDPCRHQTLANAADCRLVVSYRLVLNQGMPRIRKDKKMGSNPTQYTDIQTIFDCDFSRSTQHKR